MSEELEQFVEDLKRAANENRELFMGSIQMLAGAVDEKDPYTRGHSDRVTRYSVMIAREMGQPEEFLEIVRVSAQLHDVGKIGIEDRILKKPGALTSEEFDIMKTHTSKGAHILRPVAQLKDMIPGIELHHESLDGRGYPHGLKGDDIPLLPRIIAVADTFDALTTNRPYQEARDPEAALRIIHNISGKRLDRATLDDLEATLIGADLGTATTHEVLGRLREKADRKQIKNVDELKRLLKEELLGILTSANSQPVQKVDGTPEVILVVGVNGTGKTTTIGKLAQVFRSQGKTALLCAADTFRAAAIEQLKIWGERTGTEVIRTKPGGDPSAVLFDALQAASARHTDFVIVDTAGRLHTKTNLMAELEKMRRTAQRIIPGAPHETLLVMDATTGQNGLQQARLFTQSAGVTGIVLVKLDGTAKGGVAAAISPEVGLPVRKPGVV